MEQKLSSQGTVLYTSASSQTGSALSTVNPTGLPTVIFIHHMWGNHRVNLRHMRFLNSLGYNCVSFDLDRCTTIKETLLIDLKHPLKPLYQSMADQIRDVMDSTPGDKIVYGFSGPSLAGFIACEGRTDIKAYICDGGPFKELWTCTYRMFLLQTSIPTKFLKALTTTVGIVCWGLGAFPHLQKTLRNWNTKIPILSIRGAKDPIVYPENIEAVFKDQPQLKLTRAALPEGGHVDGLKKFPQEYENILRTFLSSF